MQKSINILFDMHNINKEKLRKKLSILALTLSATVIATPAFAQTSVNHSPSVSTQETDLSFAFDNVDNLQATDMTLAEMQETEGAVAPVVVAYGIRMGVMGTIGVGTNAWNHYSNTGKWSWGAAGRGFVGGALAGAGAKYLGGKEW